MFAELRFTAAFILDLSEVSALRPPIRLAMSACLALFLALGTVTFGGASPAFAGKLARKQAQAAAVQKQLASLTKKAEIAQEAYGVARQRYQAVTVKVKSAAWRLTQLKRRQSALQAQLGSRADRMYRDGGDVGVLDALLSSRSMAQVAFTFQALSDIADANAATVAQIRGAKARTQAAHHVLLVSQAQAGHQRAVMAANAAKVHREVAQTTKVLAGIQSDVKRLIAEQEAAAAARYMGSSFLILGGNPPTSSKGAAAVWWAEKALGRPYVWGATGPNAFDCSGLCLWAYAHVGISLPHYSGAQFQSGPHVGRAYLQPGDLVFFGHPIHHVGMYIGGGHFIEAPYTGARVRISSLGNRGDYAGATRP
jgi:cell wall-associated NlpC family hydrolase